MARQPVSGTLPGHAGVVPPLSGVPAGIHAILHLPPGAEEDSVVAQALERGLTLEGLSAFAANRRESGRHRPRRRLVL
ncbi:hypothetical protein [Actinotalea subterranea]|uniref:hypothetical protein n=1 Tax=Actinotalea subterranea TaxID=2607497 RepID=UPI0011EEB695|nr:hypothetical protein [Actinotalea subterranea]